MGTRPLRDVPRGVSYRGGPTTTIAQLGASSWVLRRGEKIDLTAEQEVRRRITLELLVPADAPTFVDHDGRRLRCVPLSVMRRRTLIGLDIRDEEDLPLSLPGLRTAQALDQSLLLAAAACRLCDGRDCELPVEVRDWVQRAVCGELEEVRQAYAKLAASAGGPLAMLRDSPLFMAALQL